MNRFWPGLMLVCSALMFAKIANADAFVPTGDMAFARYHGTATLLLDGKVLMTGGTAANGPPLDSAALYDPATGVFTPSQSHMLTARAEHVAIRLQDGKVLIAGGGFIYASEIPNFPPPQAEIYDPATDTFAPTGSMAFERLAPGVTLLPDGTVLFVGGRGCCRRAQFFMLPQGLASAEIYDPVAGTFGRVGYMAGPRAYPAIATLADDTVLVTGGSWDYVSQIGTTLIVDTHVVDSAETYLYPSPQFFLTDGPMAAARTGHAAVRLQDDSVLIAYAAYDPENYYLNTVPADVERFDANTGQGTGVFTSAGAPPAIDRTDFAPVLLGNGNVLMAGGTQLINALPNPIVASADVYVPSLHAFVPTQAPMSTARAGHTVTMLADGRVLIAGGIDAQGNWLASAEIYDPNLVTDKVFKDGFDSALPTVANAVRGASPQSTCPDLVTPIWTSSTNRTHEWFDKTGGRVCRSTGP